MNSEKKNKHMQLEDRVEIQECLYRGMTFKAIAKRIGKDPTTVSKEVKLHAIDYKSGFTKTDDTCPKLLKPICFFNRNLCFVRSVCQDPVLTDQLFVFCPFVEIHGIQIFDFSDERVKYCDCPCIKSVFLPVEKNN